MKKKHIDLADFVLYGVCILGILLVMSLVLSACNGQYMAKNWGSTYTIDLDPGYKLVEITWKDEDNLWYLVRPFEEGEEPTEYLFKEESAYDIIEGTVKIIEHKKEEENNDK